MSGLFLFPLTAEDSKISKKIRQTHTDVYGRNDMQGSQIERLKKDSKELKHYIKKVEKKGNETLAYKLQRKYNYLTSRIIDIEEAMQNC